MTNRALGLVSAIALSAVASAGIRAPLEAQDPVRLAFGYQCGNRFALQNEGTSGADVAYDVVGTSEGGRLRVEPGQTVAIEPQELGDVEILVDDRVVATAQNGRVACQSSVVVVRPLYLSGRVTVVDPFYGYGYGYGSGYGYGYGRSAYSYASPLRRFVVPRIVRPGTIYRGIPRAPIWNSQPRPRNGGGSARPQNGGGSGRPQNGGGSGQTRSARPRNR